MTNSSTPKDQTSLPNTSSCQLSGGNRLTQAQKDIYKWMCDTEKLPIYGDIYRFAATLVDQTPPGYVTFVAHAGREIVNGLAYAIAGIDRKQIQYHRYLDDISIQWEDQWGAYVLDSEPPTHYEIPSDVCVNIKELIDKHKENGSAKERDLFVLSTLLGYPDKNLIPPNLAKEWETVRKVFMKYTHARREQISANDAKKVVHHFRVLENYLHISATSQYDRIGKLYAVLEEANR